MNLILRIIIILGWLLWLSSCKSSHTSTSSVAEANHSFHQTESVHTHRFDTTSQTLVTHSNQYVFIKETQTITEYDTDKPGNPIAKTTTTEKHTVQGTQAETNQSNQSANRSQADSDKAITHNSELRTQHSTEHSSVPVAQSAVKWYVVGGIIVAVISLVVAILRRRRHKKRR